MAYRRTYNPVFGELGAEVAQRWPEAGIISKKGKQTDTLGLALSGGGYRSAIFNYGVLKGLHDLGVLGQFDYLSVVSGGSWIGTPFSMTDSFRWFFDPIADHANLIEEGFESLLYNPLRLAQEVALSRQNDNYISNIFGRLLAKGFLREHGQASRYKPLSDKSLLKDDDRPFLIVNGTVNFRQAEGFHVTQECFEMTKLYSGSRSLGYVHTKDLLAKEKPLRIRDAIAISGAAIAVHVSALGGEVAGLGLSREILNYAKASSPAVAKLVDADGLDLSDGGHYNNLGIESLINRGCGYIVVIDAEHDPERKTNASSGQTYQGLKTLLRRHHIPNPIGMNKIPELNQIDQPVHVIDGDETIPDILYCKLKSSSAFNAEAKTKDYNQPDFLRNLFGAGEFLFDPQFSTAKLDYDFAEHRNLSDLGTFTVRQHADTITDFVNRSD
jgi:predicted patatin/cPLA2 family phospholipase